MKKKVKRSEVAERAGVAESTVSRALNNSPLISEAVKERVREAARELGYVPNRQAVLLASNKTMRLGLVVRTYKSFSPFSRAYFPRLLDGVLEKAEELGYSITIVLDKKNNRYKDLSHLIHSREVDGLIFSVSELEDLRFKALQEEHVPFVLVNNLQHGMDCINCNPLKGMRDAFSHIRSLGHRHIGYITGDLNYWDGTIRLDVFNKLVGEFGFTSTVVEGNFSKTSGSRGGAELLEGPDPPSLILTGSDRCALGVMEYCKEKNIAIPGDVSIIGFDDLGPARDTVPGLSTIHNPVKKTGNAAVELLVEKLQGKLDEPVFRNLDSGFIIRGTTGINQKD